MQGMSRRLINFAIFPHRSGKCLQYRRFRRAEFRRSRSFAPNRPPPLHHRRPQHPRSRLSLRVASGRPHRGVAADGVKRRSRKRPRVRRCQAFRRQVEALRAVRGVGLARASYGPEISNGDHTPMWITSGLPTDARRRPGHNNDPSLKESACLEDLADRRKHIDLPRV
jgi:hypothetical protein